MQSSSIQEEYPLLTKEEYRRRLVGMFERMQDEAVRSVEANGFSYQTIYTGLRMALGSVTGNEEHFTVAEMAEALGEPEEERILLQPRYSRIRFSASSFPLAG